MRAATLIAVLCLGGCERYQISATDNGAYRVDTRTGEVTRCAFTQWAELKCFRTLAELNAEPEWAKSPPVDAPFRK